MAINETIVTGRKFRKLVDDANKTWQRISFWSKASDCEFNDGRTAEAKVGAINGITSDLSCQDESMAASMAAVARSLNGLSFGVDADGNYGYRKPGADTVIPFSSSGNGGMFTIIQTMKLSKGENTVTINSSDINWIGKTIHSYGMIANSVATTGEINFLSNAHQTHCIMWNLSVPMGKYETIDANLPLFNVIDNKLVLNFFHNQSTTKHEWTIFVTYS